VVPSSREWTYIFLCCPEADTEGIAQQPFGRETWLRSFPNMRSQLERIPDIPEGRWAAFYDVVSSGWYRGRAAIVGDAAHAMSPNLGQAACVVMTNSVALAQALEAGIEVRDVGDRLVLPGFVDPHVHLRHLAVGRGRGIDCRFPGCTTIADVLDALRAGRPASSWPCTPTGRWPRMRSSRPYSAPAGRRGRR
jgi:2-polyprenyl-6-methoxyphenol hydroxylase-like FAD-dependent oxidoreductase